MPDITGQVVNLKISRSTRTVSQAGFGTGMAVTMNPCVVGGQYQLFTSAADVGKALGYSSPEYEAALAYFGQVPNVPPQMMVATVPTGARIRIMKARASHVYSVTINDDTQGPTEATPHKITASYTAASDGSDSIAAIATALKSALSSALSVVSTWTNKPTWTVAASGSDAFSITYAAPTSPPVNTGHWWLTYPNDDLYIWPQFYQPFGDTTAWPSAPVMANTLSALKAWLSAMDAAAPLTAAAGWYDFAFVYRIAEWYDAAAAWEQDYVYTHKLHVAWGVSSGVDQKPLPSDPEDWATNGPTGGVDYPSKWYAMSYAGLGQLFNEAVVMWADIPNFSNAYPAYINWATVDTFPDFALMGRQLSINPDTTGASTFDDKTLVGVTPSGLNGSVLSGSQFGNLVGYNEQTGAYQGKHVAVYTDLGGVGIVFGYLTPTGEWLDVFTTIAWFQARTQQDLVGVLTTGEKQPYTDGGIQAFTSAISARIKSGMSTQYPHFQPNYALDPTMGYSVTAPAAASVSTANKANRVLQNVGFQVELAGAIQTLIVSGTVSA